MAVVAGKSAAVLTDGQDLPKNVSPLSKEIVVALVGYAGAGCSTAAGRLRRLLEHYEYDVRPVKFSDLILERFPGDPAPVVETGPTEGATKLARGKFLQDKGDQLRATHGSHAVAALAVRRIQKLRGSDKAGERKVAYVLDSLKHREEVELLRRVYDLSFRLVAVHCEREKREERLIGEDISSAKFRGVPRLEVEKFMERDEKDGSHEYGQEVRDAFYLADFFVENNAPSSGGENMTSDLRRFVKLFLGSEVVRPTLHERAMYHAYAAALQSSCLSRQVGAVLVSNDGEIVSTGTNEVPSFGGGVYSEDSKHDNRCHAWKFVDGKTEFIGCHNDRKKNDLRKNIAKWLQDTFSERLALAAHPVPAVGMDTGGRARDAAKASIQALFEDSSDDFARLPGVKDIIEYSRAIHAEMGAVLSAARSGVSPAGATLYCTTYPCHNCARHLVTAGIHQVFYIEPYVKSLASELHSDAITNVRPVSDGTIPTKMAIVPFTGVGPRMYEDFFVTRGKLKKADGSYEAPAAGAPAYAVRIRELIHVEEAAAALVPDAANA